ncbi:MAG: desulfoferrodoxin [Clostridia bacterium]|nr:desulfoferrodoxin [Clostridia bacterium]MBQ5813333.1 desulfoferrodoxin [Clostridia bacterium]
MKNTKFYICAHCGNIIEMVNDAGVPPFCCGQKMNELVPNTVEASGEKHIPAVTVNENIVEVNVGSVDHPMIDVHWIEWVQLVTENGIQRKFLSPGEAPHVTFILNGEKPVAVYAYCNLHGLWKTEL